MAVRTREEIIDAFSRRLGEDTGDEALALLEDVTDTLNDMETKAGTDWEQKYNDLDASWRKRYRDRFETGTDPAPGGDPGDPKSQKPMTFDELFSERKEN